MKGSEVLKIKIVANNDTDEIEVIICANKENEKTEQLAKYIENFEKNKKFLFCKTDKGIEFINQQEIECIEIIGKNIKIITENKCYETNGRLYQIIENLDATFFLQISKSAVININKLIRLENYFSGSMLAYLKSGYKVAVTRSFLPNLKKHLGI